MVMFFKITLLAVLAMLSVCRACEKAEISSVESYSTTDGSIISNHVYMMQFDINCPVDAYTGSFYAQIDDSNELKPLVTIPGNRYHISWISGPVSPAKIYKIRIFNEQGLSQVRKALREGQLVSGVQELATLSLDHPGGEKGAWVQSETIAIACALLAFLYAFQSRASIMS